MKLFKKAYGYTVALLTATIDEPLQLVLMFRKAREMWAKLYKQKSEQRLEHLYLNLFKYKKETTD